MTFQLPIQHQLNIPVDNLLRCRVMLPKPPNETGDCMPLASPTCSKWVADSNGNHLICNFIKQQIVGIQQDLDNAIKCCWQWTVEKFIIAVKKRTKSDLML